jgi:3-hydroxy-9,10-secoandrosta-1,3,5(10)-triene-9,17-dione monooxygenase reductase component
MTTLDKEGLREALGQFATGVTIVTTVGEGDKPVGVTANSFNSVSLNPPMVLWSLSAAAYSRGAFVDARYFCVHVLAADQEGLSRKFAARGSDKFANVNWKRGLGSVPLLQEYAARFQCRKAQQFPVGDHVVIVGEVLEFHRFNSRPLVFHGGQYALAERRMMARIARELGGEPSDTGDRSKKGMPRS